MWSLIIDMISAKSTELDNKVIRGAEDNHKDSGNKSCAAESSDSFLSFSERESMTTKQDANSQEIEASKLLAVKLVREAIERILLPEVQDHSSDNQLVVSEVCTEENSNESDTKNEECDKASKSDKGNVTRDNTGSPEKQENEERVTNKAEKKAPTHWSNLKRWIILQRFIKELEKLRKFNPRKPQYLQLEPDLEVEKVNLKHQIEDERKSAEEWMFDYALQKAISQLTPTQKRKVGLLVTAFENVVPPRGSNIQVTFPKLKSRNKVNLQTACKGNTSVSNADNVREHVDKRNAKDDRSMSKNDDTQKAIESVEIEEFGDSNDDSTSFTISNLGNNGDETQVNNMNLSECEKIEAHQHVAFDITSHSFRYVVSKIGNEQLDEINNNKTLDDISHNGRSFSINDVVNFIREAVSQILTTLTRDDSSNTQSVTNDIVQDEEPPKTNHTDGREQNSTNSLYESLRHRDSQLETTYFIANNTITESKFEPPKSKNWSKLKKLILLKRSIKVLERARKVNP
ncbi:hypothetical protein R3W88_014582 [Solanum pinnatisectum]|uniref:Calmodulin-binding domain-containing protein n=1 Tax=Solanum pinnatisectum TaxID=50273 RepID=A0AAV9KS50_9SOLN|nr:hypothetical protein R3W88_014582 [Solanum pinnatisectum]